MRATRFTHLSLLNAMHLKIAFPESSLFLMFLICNILLHEHSSYVIYKCGLNMTSYCRNM
jgi:hypothetical protein